MMRARSTCEARMCPCTCAATSWSWTARPNGPASLDTLLGGAISYGFSFVGFSQEARGRLSMDELEITLASG